VSTEGAFWWNAAVHFDEISIFKICIFMIRNLLSSYLMPSFFCPLLFAVCFF